MRGARERDGLSDQLVAAQERIAELKSELDRLSSRDRLGEELLTLSAFRHHLELDVTRARRSRRPLAVVLFDLDGFRSVNANHGYVCGDEVLTAVGGMVAAHTRGGDLACRTGGDEFAIALHETDADAAMTAAERLLRDLEGLAVGPVHGLSASAGVTGITPASTADDLIAAAGMALGRAREAGGGRAAAFGGETNGNGAASHEDVVMVLTSALEERDRYTGDHSMSLVDLTTRVADSIGLGPDEINAVRTAAVLHDIGKIGVPDAILHKPASLDESEWEIMREHPLIGERIIRAIPGMGKIARIVRHEHERWDGGGYPDGLAGELIPIGSRVILACDAYHAMVSDRPYRKAMPHADAIAELTGNAGSQFDKRVVEALVGYLYGRRQSGLPTV